MRYSEKKTKRGIIKTLIIVVAAIILIVYFRNDIQSLLSSAKIKGVLLTAITWMQQALLWVVGKLGWASGQIK